MNEETSHNYTLLSQQLVETYERFMRASINDRERLWDEFLALQDRIHQLIRQEPELKEIFYAMLEERSIDRFLMQEILYEIGSDDLLEELQAFADGKPLTFTDLPLSVLIEEYETDLAFQERCRANPAIWKAFLYWQAEYHRRMKSNAIFAAGVLRGKLLSIMVHFSFSQDGEISQIPVSSEGAECTYTKVIQYDGTVGLSPVKLNDTELELLYQFYTTSPEFRKILDNNTASKDFHKVKAYFLKEYQRKKLES